MLNVRTSRATKTNAGLERLERNGGEPPSAWIARAAAEQSDCAGVRVLLLGGAGAADLRIRVAQANARHDMSPSHWSQAALVDGDRLLHVPLDPFSAENPAATNGVREDELASLDAQPWRNLALLSIPSREPKLDAIRTAVARFSSERGEVDCLGLALAWLAYAWGVGRGENPLLDGRGLPGAVFVESVLAAVGIDAVPGMAGRGSCPEMLWQAAKWWQDYYASAEGCAPSGHHAIAHRLEYGS